MRIFQRISLLMAGAALAAPAMAAAQALQAEQVLDQDAVEVVSRPVIQPLGEPQAPLYPQVMRWPADRASALLEAIEGIAAEGLDPRDYRPGPLRAAIEIGEGAELDALASESFTWLVEDLRDGRTPMSARKQWFVVDPDPDLLPTGKLMRQALESGDVSGTLASLNPTHPDYAALKAALAEAPEDDAQQRAMIRANMDRWRWLARDLGGQYLITNVPEYRLRLTVNDQIVRSYKTIVGKPGRTATPQLAETVEGVIFNPTWTVPQSIVKGEGLGQKVLNNPAWAKAKGYKATRGADGYIGVVQQPGPANSLGMMKLDMPNPHAIFLHDTPARNLFDQEDRALSHGCIRTERALELAMTIAILGQGASKEEAIEISRSGTYTRVPVEKTMPVYITYFTMGRDVDGNLTTFPDIYDRDDPVLASLDAPRIANRARETKEEVVEIVDDLQI
ncbi:murein L,D-transpeptidase YcbB/YkuD [Altererythrobacter atlanticus]|uniref:Murein L,D-transpeptidase n=1 Tax=Croceibacterium atlanticum TaxID=1267766 RepID=A0A0F7KV75_9SPHN|nr:L,D-transpeptidase family protein [Croceibacterium atlanticum]AKH42660.1 murein L,D-transpeptidase [Croceibacterium atlanticum]MBB5731437.1 murein L,D-transpeptidase YcbB/YkuD [Croceibacterium atlanticum]